MKADPTGREGAAAQHHGCDPAALADLARAAASSDAPTTGRLARAIGLDRPDGPDALGTVRALHRHHLAEIVVGTLTAGGEHALADVIAALHGRVRRRPPVPAAVLLEAYARLAGDLRGAGVPLILLKGPLLAERLYGDVDRRPQHDLDVLVPRAARRAAHRVLVRSGFRRTARDRHGSDYVRGALRVDLHHSLRAAPAYRIDEREVWARHVRARVGATAVLALADEHLLLLLALSAAEDAAHGMAKLKQVCDLWLLARELDGHWDWPGWLERRRRDRTLPVAAAGLGFAIAALDAWADTPALRAALEQAPDTPRAPCRSDALELLAAPRGSPTGLAWFGTLYPGSLLAYRAQGILAGLPGSLRSLGPAWPSRQVALIRARRARRGPGRRSADVHARDGPTHH